VIIKTVGKNDEGEGQKVCERECDESGCDGERDVKMKKPFGVQVTFISCAKRRDNPRENMSLEEVPSITCFFNYEHRKMLPFSLLSNCCPMLHFF